MVKALVPGRKHKGVEVWISPDIALVKGEIDRGQAGRTKLFRSITFPQSVNPETVHAVIDNGMLSIRVEIAVAYKGITVTRGCVIRPMKGSQCRRVSVVTILDQFRAVCHRADSSGYCLHSRPRDSLWKNRGLRSWTAI